MTSVAHDRHPVLTGVAAVGGSLVVFAGALALTGHAPGPALASWWRGSFGSWYSLTSATLVRAVPLLFTGLATAVAFRAGVINIGVEGQLLVGATAAAACVLATTSLGRVGMPLGLIAGAMGGCCWAALAAILKRRFGVLEVISTLMLNAVATQLVAWMVRGPLQEPSHTYPQTATIGLSARLPIVLPGTRLHAGFLLAVALAVLCWWTFTRTAAGFRARVVGANSDAAASAGGIDVARVTFLAFLASGAIAGIAGAIEVQGAAYAMYDSLSPGYGYTGIAVALLARLDARAVIPSALLFAGLESGSSAMQRDAGVPAVLVKVVEAVLILSILAFDAWRTRGAASVTASA